MKLVKKDPIDAAVDKILDIIDDTPAIRVVRTKQERLEMIRKISNNINKK